MSNLTENVRAVTCCNAFSSFTAELDDLWCWCWRDAVLLMGVTRSDCSEWKFPGPADVHQAPRWHLESVQQRGGRSDIISKMTGETVHAVCRWEMSPRGKVVLTVVRLLQLCSPPVISPPRFSFLLFRPRSDLFENHYRERCKLA